MKFIILAPSRKVHIVDDWFSGDHPRTICGRRMGEVIEGGHARQYSSINIPAGEAIEACNNCETVFLGRERLAAVARHMYPDEKAA